MININNIFYINLKRRTDRNNHMTKLLKKHGLLAYTTRIDAIDGNSLTDNDFESLIQQNIVAKDGITDAKNPNQQLYTYLTRGTRD